MTHLRLASMLPAYLGARQTGGRPDTGTQFEAWRSIDGGVTFDSCATNQSGQCVTATYTDPGTYTLNDYGVKNNFKYSYYIYDSEGPGYWYMASPFQGSLTKPAPVNPDTAPSITLGDPWTDGSVAKVKLNLMLVGSPPHGTLWAHSYTVSYYDDADPTVRTVTGALRRTAVIALGQAPLPALFPFRNYHIKIRGNGMSANTPYSAETHVRILPQPDLYHAAVVAGTSISMQWSSVDWAAGVEYDVLYQKVSPEPRGSLTTVSAGTQRVWNLTDLEAQTVYQVQVRARDQWDNPSQPSIIWALETGTAAPTDVASPPTSLGLEVYPIPFTTQGGRVSFALALPQTEQVELVVFDVRGQLVRTVLRGAKPAGRYILRWDGRDDRGKSVAGGIYLARVHTNEKTITQKLVLTK